MVAKVKTRAELEKEYTVGMTQCYTIANELMAKHKVPPPKVPKPPKVVEVSDTIVNVVKTTSTKGIESKRDLDAAICNADGYKDVNQLKVIYTSLEAAGVIRYVRQTSAGRGATITLVEA